MNPEIPSRGPSRFMTVPGLLLTVWGLWTVLKHPSLTATLMGVVILSVGLFLLVRLVPSGTGVALFSFGPLRIGTSPTIPLGLAARSLFVLGVLATAVMGRLWMGRGEVSLSLLSYGVCAVLIRSFEGRIPTFSPPARGAGDPLDWKKTHLVVILLVGAFFLFYRLPSWPHWLHNDGAMTLKAALGFLSGQFTTPFFAEWGDNPTLPSLLYAGSFRLFGVSLLSAAIVPCGVTLLALPFLYGWARFFTTPGNALMTAILFASSRWIVFFVRTPREVSLLPAFEAAALYFFVAAVETGRRRDFALFALSLTLCLNTYLPSRAVAAFFAISFLSLLILRPRAVASQGRLWFLSAGVFLATILPLALWFSKHPQALVSRMREVQVFTAMDNVGGWAPLGANIAATLRMFDVQGMGDPHFNLSALPMFADPVGICMWVGLFWCAWRAVRDLALPEAFVWGGFFLTLLTTLLALPPAHPMRSIVCVPFALLAAVLGADRLARSVVSVLPGRFRSLAIAALLAAVAVIQISFNWDVYFRRMPASQDLWSWCEGTHLLSAQTLASVPADRDLYASLGYAGYNHEQVLTHGRSVGVLEPGKPLPALGRSGRISALLVAHEQDPILGKAIQQAYPTASRKVILDPYGGIRYLLYEVPPPEPVVLKESS